MLTKMARRDYELQLQPAPGTCKEGGEAMLCCFREEEEKTRGACITILSSNDYNGFTSFKINVLKHGS